MGTSPSGGGGVLPPPLPRDFVLEDTIPLFAENRCLGVYLVNVRSGQS